jgi:hypothetical protein
VSLLRLSLLSFIFLRFRVDRARCVGEEELDGLIGSSDTVSISVRPGIGFSKGIERPKFFNCRWIALSKNE